ncbi:uncharacterized protein LOC129569724 [Sitodiplosis mosellana]|uniref:uncharacterized protein LOC129569724 n=1 Tax=Sitodiplosis mosellana TaxID=263140 RepID=UPI0024443FC3|nr:uncharacterized protein LOC129569724 [Sitodiplosis mosellana]
MDDGQRIGKWEIAGFVVGCCGILLSGTSLYLWDHDEEKLNVEIVPFALALNLIASLMWICGIFLKETKFLLLPLVWWSIILTVWLILYFILGILLLFFSDKFHGGNDSYVYWSHHKLNILASKALPITALALLFYIAAVKCYIELKKEIGKFLAEIAQFGILNNESKQLDA